MAWRRTIIYREMLKRAAMVYKEKLVNCMSGHASWYAYPLCIFLVWNLGLRASSRSITDVFIHAHLVRPYEQIKFT